MPSRRRGQLCVDSGGGGRVRVAGLVELRVVDAMLVGRVAVAGALTLAALLLPSTTRGQDIIITIANKAAITLDLGEQE